MSELWRWNQEYQDILPSEGFADRIRATMAKERKHRRRQRTLSVVGGTAAALVVAVNVSPTLVYAAKDIPLLGSLVEIVTFGRYDFQDGGYEAEVVTPEIRGLVDQDLQDRLNQEFQDNADALICAFSEDVQELKEEFGEDTVHMRVEQNYEVKTDTDDYLALDVYTFFASGSAVFEAEVSKFSKISIAASNAIARVIAEAFLATLASMACVNASIPVLVVIDAGSESVVSASKIA